MHDEAGLEMVVQKSVWHCLNEHVWSSILSYTAVAVPFQHGISRHISFVISQNFTVSSQVHLSHQACKAVLTGFGCTQRQSTMRLRLPQPAKRTLNIPVEKLACPRFSRACDSGDLLVVCGGGANHWRENEHSVSNEYAAKRYI